MKKFFITLSIFGLIHAQSVVKVIPAPYRSGGLTFDGEHLWSGIYAGSSSYIFEIDTSSGSVIIQSRRQGMIAMALLMMDNTSIFFSTIWGQTITFMC